MIDDDVDFVSLSETKLNNDNVYVKQSLTNIIESHSSNAKVCVTNTPGYGKDTCSQPGGVMSIAIGNLKGRYAGMGCDNLGRYNWMRFCGRKRTLKIYTFYRVSQSSGVGLGDTTAYVQQYNILNRSGSTLGEGNDSRNKRHIGNPRENIINSLTQDVTKDVHKGEFVIILGDLN